MKLAELSPLYEDSAQRIQRRMEQLRLDLRTADDPDVRIVGGPEVQPQLLHAPLDALGAVLIQR